MATGWNLPKSNGPDPMLSGLASFFTNFASTYNVMRESELDRHFKDELQKREQMMKTKESLMEHGTAENEKYQLKDFQPVTTSSMMLTDKDIDAINKEALSRGHGVNVPSVGGTGTQPLSSLASAQIQPGESALQQPAGFYSLSEAGKMAAPGIEGYTAPKEKPKKASSAALRDYANTLDNEISRTIESKTTPLVVKRAYESLKGLPNDKIDSQVKQNSVLYKSLFTNAETAPEIQQGKWAQVIKLAETMKRYNKYNTMATNKTKEEIDDSGDDSSTRSDFIAGLVGKGYSPAEAATLADKEGLK